VFIFPSAYCHHWLGTRAGIWPVKTCSGWSLFWKTWKSRGIRDGTRKSGNWWKVSQRSERCIDPGKSH